MERAYASCALPCALHTAASAEAVPDWSTRALPQTDSTQTLRKGGRQYVGTVDGAADPVHFGLPDHLAPYSNTLTVASRGAKSCIEQARDAKM